MDRNGIDFSIHINHPGELMLWLACLCALGFVITMACMRQVSNFFFYKKEMIVDNVKTKTEVRFSIFNFELPTNYKRFNEIVNGLSDKTKEALKKSLHIDYYFMPFAYLLLFFLSFYFYLGIRYENRTTLLHLLLLFPFIAWVLDIVENVIAAACLNRLSPLKASLLLTASALKWLLVIACIAYIIISFFACLIYCTT